MNAVIFQAANLVILLSVLIFVARKKMIQFYAQQAKEFQAKLKDASAQFEETKTAFESLKAQVDDLDGRLGEMRRMSMKEIESESERLESETERQIEQAIHDGEVKLKIETERLRKTLERELVERALSTAKKTLERDLKTHDAEWTSQMIGSDALRTGKKNYAS